MVTEFSNAGSLFMYIGVFSISSVLLFFSQNVKNHKIDRVLMICSVLLPSIIAYERYNVGTDYGTYAIVYKNYSELQISDFLNNTELLYSWGVFALSKLAYYTFGTKMFFGLFSFITNYIFVVSLKQYNIKNRGFTYLLFLLSFYPPSLNIMKQSLATVIVFWGLRYVYERKLLKYLIVVIVAITFHTTAIVAIPIYYIYNQSDKIWNFKTLFWVFAFVIISTNILSILSSLSNVDFMNISRFSSYSYDAGTNNYTFIVVLFEFVVILLFQKYYVRFDNKLNLLVVLVALGLCFSATGFFSTFIKRISSYYSSISIVLLLSLLPEIRFKGNNILIMRIAVLSYYFILFMAYYYIYGFSDVFPYRTISV